MPSPDIKQGALEVAEGRVRIHVEGIVLSDGQQIVLQDILQS